MSDKTEFAYTLTDAEDDALSADGKAKRWWRRKPRHQHTYERVGYGGAGWSLYRCTTCGGTEINA